MFQSKTLACNSLFMSLIPMDEISVAKFRLTSALGRQSQRPGWAAQGCTAVPGPAVGGRSGLGGSSTKKASPHQAGRREEPAAAHTVVGVGCSLSSQAKQMNRKQFPRVALCTSLFWGLLKRVGRERMADGLWVARKSNMSVLLKCNEASSRSL